MTFFVDLWGIIRQLTTRMSTAERRIHDLERRFDQEHEVMEMQPLSPIQESGDC